MNDQNTPYYNQQQPGQQPMGAPMMQPPMPQQAPRGWRARWMRQLGSGNGILAKNIWPKWLSQYAIATYMIALAVVTIVYSSYSLPWYYFISGIASVLIFFLYGKSLAEKTSVDKIRKDKNFEKRIFWIAFLPRFVWMITIYAIFMEYYGDAFGFENADAPGYDEMATRLSSAIREGHLSQEWDELRKYYDFSDMGYASYLGVVYWFTRNSIIAARLLKCVWSALTVVLVFRLAKRNFGDQPARITAIFCALWPNFWYYCGCHLKETEMVFLIVLFMEQADQMLRSRQFTAWKIIPLLLIVGAMFTFRTVLALVALLALLLTIVMASSRLLNWGKRIIVGFVAIAMVGVIAGNRIQESAKGLVEQVQGGYQAGNMEYRAIRKDSSGNKQAFAKYAGAAVFAPMIFTIPFPTMVSANEEQHVQQMLNGGNITKNILSFFVVFSIIVLLLSGKWREHILPLSFMIGYVIVLTMSAFAHSERFHQPVMPFELMFATYGLSVVAARPKYKRWFMYWCVVMFVAAVAWSWFKLRGRGLI